MICPVFVASDLGFRRLGVLPRQNCARPETTGLPVGRSYRDRWLRSLVDGAPPCIHSSPMLQRIASILGWLRSFLASRSDLLIENLALRQQLAILTAKRPRPRMRTADRVFWVALRRLWPRWRGVLVVVRPDTVVRWHREGFRRYWTWKSRRRSTGRPSTAAEIRTLVRRMTSENPTWGAPRIHGELLMLGYDVSERTVSRSMRKRPADPEARQRWRNFLCNHREVLAAMDFFTVCLPRLSASCTCSSCSITPVARCSTSA